MDFDDTEIDPALAAAMGFSSFGGAPNKRRKVNNDGDGFIDPEISKSGSAPTRPPGTGANSVMTSTRRPAPVTQTSTSAMANSVAAGHVGAEAGAAQPHISAESVDTLTYNNAARDTDDLAALRNGVRNAQGDMAFFKPSFLEDPWKDLRESKKA
jgi:hypothetical protein